MLSQRFCYGTVMTALVVSCIVPVAAVTSEELECTTQQSVLHCDTCEGEFKILALFLTFQNVVAVTGDSLLPSWADSISWEFRDFIEALSLGKHLVNYEILRRPEPDEECAWVMSKDSDDYAPDEFYAELESLLGPNWWSPDSSDLIIYHPYDKIDNIFENPATSCGCVCDPLYVSCGNDYTDDRNQMIIRVGYLDGPQWNAYHPCRLRSLLVHEYGHQLGGSLHLPDRRNGELEGGEEDPCDGRYWGCYGAMDRQLMAGCEERCEYNNGYVPYHPLKLIDFGWVEPTVIDTTTLGVELRDIRLGGEVVKIPLYEDQSADYEEYFLIVNHQMTEWDSILQGRGLLIWHVGEKEGSATSCASYGSYISDDILDLEHMLGEWEADDPAAPLCPDWPHEEDAISGMDTLDCASDMLPAAFYGGLSLVKGRWKEFGPETNPSTHRYDLDDYGNPPSWRGDPQSIPTGVALRNFSVAPDFFPNKYIVKFDIIVE